MVRANQLGKGIEIVMLNTYSFEDIASYFDPGLYGTQSTTEEEVIIRYTRGTGRFSTDKKYITLTMKQYKFDCEPDGYHEGVWEAQFRDPRELLQRPANPTEPMNEPHGPIEHLSVVAQTKGIWVFGD